MQAQQAGSIQAQQVMLQLEGVAKMAKRLYREVKLLRFMRHPNVIGMLDLYGKDGIIADQSRAHLTARECYCNAALRSVATPQLYKK